MTSPSRGSHSTTSVAAAFIAATEVATTTRTWVRARAWAVAVILMLLSHSDDEPAYAALGREALVEAVVRP